ncbi:aldose epimerase family protein [Thalassotalea sp. PS06]|uniref:aldose epimerase family protein n=1 Tax=Thalassotalea sp. PS06 TaxID=2594005 RepID=UPI0011637673|nr:aldose epimerase family protein [Thalassotalea sp. PS06]QDP02404.1 galactose mutarotase [Thalassotalea sp. PS06]
MSNELKSVTLTNGNGMEVTLLNLGARLASIKFAGKEMLVTYADLNGFLNDDLYLGATCGRVCNRISDGRFILDGENYTLAQNNGGNCLHGGDDNFSYRFWDIQEEGLTEQSVTMTLHSEDGDQGFPGNLDVSVSYRLTGDNQLHIDFQAKTDKATPVNLTNHAYFNLGEKSGQALQLQLMASTCLNRADNEMPDGTFRSVLNTDFNFRELTSVGERQQHTQDPELVAMGGFDHCFILDNSPFATPKARLVAESQGIEMRLYTDQTAVQFYTGKYLDGEFESYQGLCLEAQNYTDAVNQAHFPNSVLRPEQTYQQTIVYEFFNL